MILAYLPSMGHLAHKGFKALSVQWDHRVLLDQLVHKGLPVWLVLLVHKDLLGHKV